MTNFPFNLCWLKRNRSLIFLRFAFPSKKEIQVDKEHNTKINGKAINLSTIACNECFKIASPKKPGQAVVSPQQ